MYGASADTGVITFNNSSGAGTERMKDYKHWQRRHHQDDGTLPNFTVDGGSNPARFFQIVILAGIL